MKTSVSDLIWQLLICLVNLYCIFLTGCDSSTSKWVGWSTKPEANVEKPKTVDAPSLAEIMRSEREVVIKSPVITTERKMSPADVKINVVKKSSWRQLSFEEEKAAKMIAASSSPPINPWKIPTAEMPMSTMPDSSTTFKQVINFIFCNTVTKSNILWACTEL